MISYYFLVNAENQLANRQYSHYVCTTDKLVLLKNIDPYFYDFKTHEL